MKIYKPEWITHSTEKHKIPIYSISIDLKSNRIATAAQDFKIKIWDFRSILDYKSENALLSVLEMHDGAVLCVRWSSDGAFLASGSDDCKIVIWERDLSGQKSSFGQKNIEHYRALKVITGHESDVSGLAWSPNSTYLASCGFDGKVFIWDGSTFEKITCLEMHTAFVKGVCWDPAGTYLATQSDDKSVLIYRVQDWRVEKEIVAPYVNVGSTTFFRRPSWSPDGNMIATANGQVSGVCVAPILHRDDWNTLVFLVGHEAPVEVAAFNPHLFMYTDANGVQKETAVCAIGSQDNGISVWWTGSARAIVSAQQVFSHSVLDLAWSGDGMVLMGCSYDGTISVMEFEESDFGTRLSEHEVGCIRMRNGSKMTNELIPQSKEVLEMERVIRERQRSPKKVESNASQRVSNGHGNGVEMGKGAEKTVIDLEAKEPNQLAARIETTAINENNPFANRIESAATSVGFVQPQKEREIMTEKVLEKQTTTIMKDGKKRIRPVLVQSTSNNQVVSEHNSQSQPVSQNGVEKLNIKKQRIDINNVASSVPDQEHKVTYVLPMVISKENTVNLQIPKPRSVFMVNYRNGVTNRQDTMEVKNIPAGSFLTVRHGLEVAWTCNFKSSALLGVYTSKYVALALVDCTLHIFNTFGMWMMPPLCLNAAVSYMCGQDEILVYLDSSGYMRMWNVIQKRLLLETSVLPLLSKEQDSIKDVSIKNGRPVITTTLQEKYIYCFNMKVWLKLELCEADHGIPKSLPKTELVQLQLLSALELENKPDIINCYKRYARKVSSENNETLAKELLNDLAGDGDIKGIQRKELFDIVFEIIGVNRSFQHFLLQYKQHYS